MTPAAALGPSHDPVDITVTPSVTSVSAGGTITLTANVTGTTSAAPHGYVIFNVNQVDGSGSSLASCSGLGSTSECPVTLSSGSVSGTASGTLSLSAGVYDVTAQFTSSDGSYGTTMSPAVSLSFIGTPIITTTTSLTASPAVVTAGQTVNLSASVLDSAGNPITGGDVQFLNSAGNTLIGSASVQSGVATLSQANGFTTTGAIRIVALYLGYANYAPSSSSVAVAVTGVPPLSGTTTTLYVDPSQIARGGAVQLSATVVDANDQPVTGGQVQFVSVIDGVQNVIAPPAQLLSGVATSVSDVGWPAAGDVKSYVLEALYSGAGTDSASQATATLAVLPAPADTTTVVSASPTNLAPNTPTPVTLTATVTASSLSSGATGQVEFLVNGAVVGEATLQTTSAGPTATLSTTLTYAAGTYPVSAVYLGDSADLASVSANTANLVVAAALPTATTGSGPSAAVPYGSPVTLSAIVAQSPLTTSAAPTGSVSFTYSGGTLCTPLPTLTATASGTSAATCTASAQLPVGITTVTSTYSGVPGSFSPSSGTFAVTVARASTTTTVSGPATAQSGTPVTFTATVVGVAPTGSVTFNGPSGLLCTAALTPVPSNPNAATATCTTTATTPGPLTVTTAYSGDTDNSASSGSATTTVVATTVGCDDTGDGRTGTHILATTSHDGGGTRCENFLASSDSTAQPGKTLTATYGDETAISTATPPTAMLWHNGAPVAALAVTVGRADTGPTRPGDAPDNESGHLLRADGAPPLGSLLLGLDPRTASHGAGASSTILSITVPLSAGAGDVVQLTVHDSDGDVDQLAWTVVHAGFSLSERSR